MDIINAITDIRVDTKHSDKTGRDYKVLVIVLTNGYEIRTFIHPAEISVIESLVTK